MEDDETDQTDNIDQEGRRPSDPSFLFDRVEDYYERRLRHLQFYIMQFESYYFAQVLQ